MAYRYDLFVSYVHDQRMESWVHEHLLPFIRSFVGNALNRPLEIFVDRTGLTVGDAWPMKLRAALATSRCLLPIWAPLYFHSQWCRRECTVMLHREMKAGFRTLANPGGLVLPINVFDGDFFPYRARQVQWLDCKKFWLVGEGFAKTERYIEFQETLRTWSMDLAAAITRAPDWDENWMDESWIELPDDELHPVPLTNFAFTGLE